jgi:hypothetical protein
MNLPTGSCSAGVAGLPRPIPAPRAGPATTLDTRPAAYLLGGRLWLGKQPSEPSP